MESVLVSSCSPHLAQVAGQGCSAAGRRGGAGQTPAKTSHAYMPHDPPLLSLSPPPAEAAAPSFPMRHETCLYRHDQTSLWGLGDRTHTREGKALSPPRQGQKDAILFTHFHFFSLSQSLLCFFYSDQNFIDFVFYSFSLSLPFFDFPPALRQKLR